MNEHTLSQSHSDKPGLRGGLAQYCVEHREVAWMALIAVLIWGWSSYRLQEGCGTPNLDTDFGNTVTLLFGLISPPPSESETMARANLVRSRLAKLRATTGSQGRAAALVFFPPAISPSHAADIGRKFETALALGKLGDDIKVVQGKSFIMAEFKTAASRAEILRFIGGFTRSLVGSENEPHPDGGPPIVLMGDEDPLPVVSAAAMPRYSYRELEKAAEILEDEFKQIASVGRVRKIGNVSEEVDLLFSVPVLNGYKFSGDEIMDAISSRNAIIPGGTFRAEGQNFPVQLSGEFQNEDELLGTIVSVTKDGTPVYLRDVFEVRRGYENPIPYSVEVLHRHKQTLTPPLSLSERKRENSSQRLDKTVRCESADEQLFSAGFKNKTIGGPCPVQVGGQRRKSGYRRVSFP